MYGGGDSFDLTRLPTVWWQLACVLYGGGCTMLSVAAVCALIIQIISVCLPTAGQKLASVVGGAQGIAGSYGYVYPI